MRIHLIAFGKLRTPGLRDAADYFLRNVQPWSHLEEHEFKPLVVSEKSASLRDQIQKKEAELLKEKISKFVSPRGKILLLDETGKARSTQAWAESFKDWESQSVPEVAFCIGSSLGFSAEFKRSAHGVFSLGPQTLSHELARVVLLEQIYRAWSVIKGHPYHNEG